MNSLGNSYPSLNSEYRVWHAMADPGKNYGVLEREASDIKIIQTLLEVSSELLATHDVDELLGKMLGLLSRLVSYDAAAIHMVQGEFLDTRAGDGRAFETVKQRNKTKDYVWQYLERERKPYVTADIHMEDWKPLDGFESIRSFMAVPLAIQDELIGVLTIAHSQPNQYDAKQVEMVRLFVNYTSIAIANARLLSESQCYIKDLEILQTTEIGTISHTSRRIIAQQALQTLQDGFGYNFVSIYRVVDDALHLLAQYNYPSTTVRHLIPLSTGVAARCVRERAPLLIPDVSTEPDFIAAAPNIQCELCVPIFVEDKVYGVINIESQERDKLGESDQHLVTILANKLGVTFQNLELYKELRRRLATVSTLHASSIDIASGMDEAELLNTFLERVLHLIDTSAACIFLYDRNCDALVTSAVRPDTFVLSAGDLQSKESGILGQAFNTGKAVYTSDYATFPYQDPNWPHERFQLGAVGAVPLTVKGKTIGVLGLVKEKGYQFDPEEQQLIDLFANQVATAIENRRLFQAEQRRSHQLMLLSEITSTSLQATEFQETLDALAKRMDTLLDADGCFILLWDETQQIPVPAAAFSPLSETFKGMSFSPAPDAITDKVLNIGSTVVIEDVQNSPLIPKAIVDQFPIRSVIFLPLMVDVEKIGMAIIGFNDLHLFTEEEISISRQAADQISIAIAKAKLLQTERRQRQFAEIQLAFSFQLMETTKLVDAVDALLATISEVVEYDAGSVMLLEPENPDVGYFAAVSGYTDPTEARHRTVQIQTFPLLDQMRRERKEIYFAELRGNPSWRPSHQPDPKEVRSIFMAPLLYDQQSEMIGCLTLKSYHPNAFSPEARSNITLLCNQTASAVRGIRLLEETRRRLNEVSILAEISETLNRTIELEEVLQLVLDRVMSILKQDAKTADLQGSIILRQQPGDSLRLALGYNIPEAYYTFFNSRPFYAHEGSFARSILQGEWVELDHPETIRSIVAENSPDLTLDELLNIPLKVGSEVIGVITANRIVTDPTTRRLLGAIAELAGSAIHKTRLLAQARSHAVELMEAYEALNEMDRVRDEFIQNVTHDLRAPLTFIRGYTDLMIEGAMGEINAEQRDALEVIQERTDAVNRLVSEILKVKQVESQPLKEEPVDIVAAARSAMRSALMSARRAGLEIDLISSLEQATVRGDADRLGQVFDNLLSNAIKYTGEGGRILIRLEQRWPKVLIAISDTGIGIPAAELDRIWDRYYRVRGTLKEYSGTGLGLANVRRIIEAHAGHIWVQSSSGGTTFTFELPLDRSVETSLSSGS